MSYLGRVPSPGAFLKLDDITSSFNGAQTVFNLASATVPVLPGTARNLVISIGGVMQEPEVAYTISGSTLTFTGAPAATEPFWGVVLGSPVDVGVLSAGVAIAPSTVTATGNVSTTGTLAVTGNTVSGNTVINGTLTANGAATVNGTMLVQNTITANGDLFSVDWTDYAASASIVGWSSFTAGRKFVFCKKVGKLVFVNFHLEGTSNATTASFVIPYIPYPGTGSYPNVQGCLGFAYDNGAAVGTPGIYSLLPGSGGQVNCYLNQTGAGWTASGTKIVNGNFWFQSN